VRGTRCTQSKVHQQGSAGSRVQCVSRSDSVSDFARLLIPCGHVRTRVRHLRVAMAAVMARRWRARHPRCCSKRLMRPLLRWYQVHVVGCNGYWNTSTYNDLSRELVSCVYSAVHNTSTYNDLSRELVSCVYSAVHNTSAYNDLSRELVSCAYSAVHDSCWHCLH
jgi:hypothetical protein